MVSGIIQSDRNWHEYHVTFNILQILTPKYLRRTKHHVEAGYTKLQNA